MRRWHLAQQGLKSVFLVALVLVSCSAPGSDNPEEGCGGTEATVSCLNIISVVPTSGGGPSSNVDAARHFCQDVVTGEITGAEDALTDHNADITFSNTPFPTARGALDIRVIGYSVSYRLNQCPRTARGCPPLPGFSAQSDSLLVPDGSSVTRTFPLVPLRVKNEYVASGGELLFPPPSYTALYVFTAQTTRFNDTFTVQASAEFTIADFDTCQ
ncbi:MAG: hypothetical protein AB7N91_09905 [Candidatus Tectimicrobiota bacterium]